MKRDDLQQAVLVEREVSTLEMRLAHYKDVTSFSITSGCCLELQDYPSPSMIGAGFRNVRSAIVHMLEAQLCDARRRLQDLGVSTVHT